MTPTLELDQTDFDAVATHLNDRIGTLQLTQQQVAERADRRVPTVGTHVIDIDVDIDRMGIRRAPRTEAAQACGRPARSASASNTRRCHHVAAGCA